MRRPWPTDRGGGCRAKKKQTNKTNIRVYTPVMFTHNMMTTTNGMTVQNAVALYLYTSFNLSVNFKQYLHKFRLLLMEFNVHGPVRRKNILIYISKKIQRYTVYFIWKLLYMFWMVTPSIIRSANKCIYSIWYLSHRYCYLQCVTNAVDTVVCAPDDGWRYQPKHVE